ncbi:uncharacterized protein V6R79_023348 [Siganus canaliculatus]
MSAVTATPPPPLRCILVHFLVLFLVHFLVLFLVHFLVLFLVLFLPSDGVLLDQTRPRHEHVRRHEEDKNQAFPLQDVMWTDSSSLATRLQTDDVFNWSRRVLEESRPVCHHHKRWDESPGRLQRVSAEVKN